MRSIWAAVASVPALMSRALRDLYGQPPWEFPQPDESQPRGDARMKTDLGRPRDEDHAR